MAERKAVNKYYPPDWNPDKGSINKYVGQHPLRDRARKLDQGILIVRFELPFNIWCGGCNAHLATGLRFNAEKDRIGEYYSTPIWRFVMKCRFCPQKFEIHTDPKTSRYLVVRGARKKVEHSDDEDVKPATYSDEEEEKRKKTDPMHILEHKILDKRKADEELERLDTLQRLNDRDWEDSSGANAKLRKRFRVGKKAREVERKEGKQLQAKFSLADTVLPETEKDRLMAKLQTFGGKYQIHIQPYWLFTYNNSKHIRTQNIHLDPRNAERQTLLDAQTKSIIGNNSKVSRSIVNTNSNIRGPASIDILRSHHHHHKSKNAKDILYKSTLQKTDPFLNSRFKKPKEPKASTSKIHKDKPSSKIPNIIRKVLVKLKPKTGNQKGSASGSTSNTTKGDDSKGKSKQVKHQFFGKPKSASFDLKLLEEKPSLVSFDYTSNSDSND